MGKMRQKQYSPIADAISSSNSSSTKKQKIKGMGGIFRKEMDGKGKHHHPQQQNQKKKPKKMVSFHTTIRMVMNEQPQAQPEVGVDNDSGNNDILSPTSTFESAIGGTATTSESQSTSDPPFVDAIAEFNDDNDVVVDTGTSTNIDTKNTVAAIFTNTNTNVANDIRTTTTLQRQTTKLTRLKEKLSKTKNSLAQEKNVKAKLYKGLVKLAAELKDAREECTTMKEAIKKNQEEMGMGGANGNGKTWYEGGMWRGPELLPGIQASARERMIRMRQMAGPAPNLNGNTFSEDDVDDSGGDGSQGGEGNNWAIPRRGKSAVSLSDLFFDLVIVTAFTRVGVAIQDRGGIEPSSFAYFIIFWLIWGKEASFSTRFDTTDLSCQVETLLTCFAVLFGSLSSTAPFDSDKGTSVMVLAAFVAMLHFLLHWRVWFWFKDVNPSSEMIAVKNYAVYIMVLTSVEVITWMIGIFVFSETSRFRGLVFLVAILVSFRLPRTFLPNDFHAACSKRGVLFILLLGFILQSIVMIASPFFDYQLPSSEQYFFLALVCFLLFCIKLLYVDDSFSVDPSDHALLVSRTAGFFFHLGQLILLLSTTVLGAGLNLLTHSYLSATASLQDKSKFLVCSGFAGVIFSIGFIKSMHLRRVPLNHGHRQLFYAAYGTQILVLLGVVYTTLRMSVAKTVTTIMMSELQMLGVLCGLVLFLLLISWLDEAVELNIYGGGDAREFRVHPFGLWTCLKPGMPQPPLFSSDTSRLSHLSPMLKDSNANLFDSQININIPNVYGSIRQVSGISGSGEDSERASLVKFNDEKADDGDRIDLVV